MTRVGIYARISEDPDGTSTATSRQLEDCRRLCEQRGWNVSDVFEDRDTSAFASSFKGKVIRPEFERLVTAVRDGEIDVVLAWKFDRLARRSFDFARLDETCESVGARIMTLVDGIDTSTSAGRLTATMLAGVARQESENISLRLKRKHREMAQQGQKLKGGHRPFGYTQDRTTIVESEAEIIREAAERVLSGEGIRAVCLDLEARGVVSSSGKPWQPSPFRRMLLSPFRVGRRDYKGIIAEGDWPAILSPETHERLKLLFLQPSRQRAMTNKRSNLLTGMIYCGRCGERLISRPTGDKVPRYVCARRPASPACGKLARVSAPVDELVVNAMFAAVDTPQFTAYTKQTATPQDAGVIEQIRRDEAALEQLAVDFYTEGRLSRSEFFAARDALAARVEDARSTLRRRNDQRLLGDLTEGGDALRRKWATESLSRRRALLASAIERITILPAVKGDNRFNPKLVQITWRF